MWDNDPVPVRLLFDGLQKGRQMARRHERHEGMDAAADSGGHDLSCVTECSDPESCQTGDHAG